MTVKKREKDLALEPRACRPSFSLENNITFGSKVTREHLAESPNVTGTLDDPSQDSH